MARKIEFLAPVEAMRGNLSGKQALKYPTKDNSAWEAPIDKRSYATNYNTRYVGAKRAADGKKYFAVKQRAAVTNTPEQREAQALLAGSKIIADAMLKDISIIARLALMLKGYVQSGLNYNPAFIPSDIVPGHPNNSLRRYLMRNIRELTLIPKNAQFFVQPQSGPDIVYNNIWVFSQASGSKVTGKTNELVKFFKQLHPGHPITFSVGGSTALGETGLSFEEIISNNPTATSYGLNVLGLTSQDLSGTEYVKLGSMFLIKQDGTFVTGSIEPSDGDKYYLSEIGPRV